MADFIQNSGGEVNEQDAQSGFAIVTTDQEALISAVEKWVQFQKTIWNKIKVEMIKPAGGLARWAITMRLTIIILSATVTTLSGILPPSSQVIITVLAGTLTAITGVEAYFKFSERIAQNKRQQRELEALRDKLRFDWSVNVEIETDMENRLAEAKRLLVEGPEEYNAILNSFAVTTEETGAPSTPGEPEVRPST
jgi:hypothetical protein